MFIIVLDPDFWTQGMYMIFGMQILHLYSFNRKHAPRPNKVMAQHDALTEFLEATHEVEIGWHNVVRSQFRAHKIADHLRNSHFFSKRNSGWLESMQ